SHCTDIAMSITIRCPQCQAEMRVRDEVVGKRVRCPKCQAAITATRVDEVPIAEVADEGVDVTAQGPRRRRPDEDYDEPPWRDHDAPRRPRRGREYDRYDDEPDEGAGPMPASVLLAVVTLCVLLGLELIMGLLALLVVSLDSAQFARVFGQLAGSSC